MSCHKRPEHRPARPAASALATALLACLIAGGPARASEVLSITIFADRYVYAGLDIDDLDVVEGTVGALRSETVRLDACEIGAERAQRAAAHRFRASNLELRRLAPDTALCTVAASARRVPTAGARGPLRELPRGIDDAAVDRWWHDGMP